MSLKEKKRQEIQARELFARHKENQPTTSQNPTMENPPSPPSIKTTDGIELRLRVVEKGNGDIGVTYEAMTINGQILVPIRPSHLLGLLRAASAILEQKIYGPISK